MSNASAWRFRDYRVKCLHFKYHRYKIRTRFDNSGSRVVVNFKLCQICQHFTNGIYKWLRHMIYVIWPGYYLNTTYKMRTRRNISGSKATIDFKLHYLCWNQWFIRLMTSFWLSNDLRRIYRPRRKYGPDLYARLFCYYWLAILSDVLGWTRDNTNDVFLIVM